MGDFEYNRENLLISGTTGSGKTTVCKLLREILTESPYFAHARHVDCRSLKGGTFIIKIIIIPVY